MSLSKKESYDLLAQLVDVDESILLHERTKKDNNKQSKDDKNDCHNVSRIPKDLDLVEENNDGGKSAARRA